MESPRAQFFTRVVDQHMFRRTLIIIPRKFHPTALMRLIVSSHRLRIETGRYERPVVCHKLDDEHHFLIHCDRYAELKSMLVTKIMVYSINVQMYPAAKLK